MEETMQNEEMVVVEENTPDIMPAEEIVPVESGKHTNKGAIAVVAGAAIYGGYRLVKWAYPKVKSAIGKARERKHEKEYIGDVDHEKAAEATTVEEPEEK